MPVPKISITTDKYLFQAADMEAVSAACTPFSRSRPGDLIGLAMSYTCTRNWQSSWDSAAMILRSDTGYLQATLAEAVMIDGITLKALRSFVDTLSQQIRHQMGYRTKALHRYRHKQFGHGPNFHLYLLPGGMISVVGEFEQPSEAKHFAREVKTSQTALDAVIQIYLAPARSAHDAIARTEEVSHVKDFALAVLESRAEDLTGMTELEFGESNLLDV